MAEEWIPGAADWPKRWADMEPERVALIDAETGQTWTYARLEDGAARLAHVLREGLGVKRGDRVALLANNQPETFVLLFACAKIGAVLVPLNWRLAAPELVEILRDCSPTALLYGRAWSDAADSIARAADVPSLLPVGTGKASSDDDDTCLLDGTRPVITSQACGGDLALILYTSGTEGLPKGVMIPWRQMVFNAVNTMVALGLRASDRCLAFLPLFHTGGLNCLATPLLYCGGSVVVSPAFDAAQSLDWIESYGVTMTIAVPTMFQMLLDAGLEHRRLSSLRVALCGGAPCPRSIIERCAPLRVDFRFGYGLTEVGPNCFYPSRSDDPGYDGNVGVPNLHAEARVVTNAGRDAIADEVGELWLRGPHVCLGYWNKPEKTAGVLDADGWFHTGDFARIDVRGRYTIVGRKKDMFISGGENVYPAEVENVIAQHEAVREVTVVGVPDDKWGEVGFAAISLRAGAPPLELDALRRWTRARIASYKVPKHWRVFGELPKNATGKIVKARVRETYRPCATDE